MSALFAVVMFPFSLAVFALIVWHDERAERKANKLKSPL